MPTERLVAKFATMVRSSPDGTGGPAPDDALERAVSLLLGIASAASVRDVMDELARLLSRR
jgi:hypothetical protein